MIPATGAGIDNDDSHAIWEAAHRLGLYARTDAELEALILHAGSPRPDARLAAEAAQHVRRLRRRLAKGDVC